MPLPFPRQTLTPPTDCRSACLSARDPDDLPEPEQKWRAWARRKFDRLYLALVAVEACDDTALTLQFIQRDLGVEGGKAQAVVIAALDGAAEYSRVAAVSHDYNGADHLVEAKDAEFYRQSGRVLAGHDGWLLQRGPTPVRVPQATDRLFQDGCVAVFPDDPVAAIAAALELHLRLAEYDERDGLPWTQQLHARVVVARTWDKALLCLRYAWRGKTVIEGEVWNSLDDNLRYVLFAAGLRRGGQTVLSAELAERLRQGEVAWLTAEKTG